MSERIDWARLVRLGTGLLRLPPDAFWSMTPAELRLALEGAGIVPIAEAGLDRSWLASLMEAYPDADQTNGGQDGHGSQQ